jgi:hypothetical protein
MAYVILTKTYDGLYLLSAKAVKHVGFPEPNVADLEATYGRVAFNGLEPNGYGWISFVNEAKNTRHELDYLSLQQFASRYPDMVGVVNDPEPVDPGAGIAFLFTLPNAVNIMVCESYRTDAGWGARVYEQASGRGIALADDDGYEYQSSAVGSAMANAIGHYFGSEAADAGDPEDGSVMETIVHTVAEWRAIVETFDKTRREPHPNEVVRICNALALVDDDPNTLCAVDFPEDEADNARDAWILWVHANTP